MRITTWIAIISSLALAFCIGKLWQREPEPPPAGQVVRYYPSPQPRALRQLNLHC